MKTRGEIETQGYTKTKMDIVAEKKEDVVRNIGIGRGGDTGRDTGGYVDSNKGGGRHGDEDTCIYA